MYIQMLGNSLEIRKKYIKKLEKKQADLNDGYALLKKLDAKIMRQNGGRQIGGAVAAPGAGAGGPVGNVDIKQLQTSILAARAKIGRNTQRSNTDIAAAIQRLNQINVNVGNVATIIGNLQTQITDILTALQPIDLTQLTDAIDRLNARGGVQFDDLTGLEQQQLLTDLTAENQWAGVDQTLNPYSNNKIGQVAYEAALATVTA